MIDHGRVGFFSRTKTSDSAPTDGPAAPLVAWLWISISYLVNGVLARFISLFDKQSRIYIDRWSIWVRW